MHRPYIFIAITDKLWSFSTQPSPATSQPSSSFFLQRCQVTKDILGRAFHSRSSQEVLGSTFCSHSDDPLCFQLRKSEQIEGEMNNRSKQAAWFSSHVGVNQELFYWCQLSYIYVKFEKRIRPSVFNSFTTSKLSTNTQILSQYNFSMLAIAGVDTGILCSYIQGEVVWTVVNRREVAHKTGFLERCGPWHERTWDLVS